MKKIISTIQIFTLISGLFLIFPFHTQAVLSSDFKQVKTKNSDTIYYLDHKNQFKKAYPNQEAYFAYGNELKDIKIISQSELDKWPDVQLAKTNYSPDIYYLKNKQKALLKPSDLANLNLETQKIATILKADLNRYQTTSLTALNSNQIALNTIQNGGGPAIADSKIMVQVDTSNVQNFAPLGTNNNLLGVFSFYAINSAYIEALTFHFGSIYEDQTIREFYLTDENNQRIPTTYINKQNRDLTFGFAPNNLYFLEEGKTKKIKVFADLTNLCGNCTNHSIQVSLDRQENIKTNVAILGQFPLQAEAVKIANGTGILGSYEIIELPITNLITNIGQENQVLAMFKIKETSNQENLLIKELVFKNNGSSVPSDAESFKLEQNGKILSTASFNNNRTLVFSTNNYILNKGKEITILIKGNLTGGSGRTINLDFDSTSIVGQEQNFSLAPNNYSAVNDNISIQRAPIRVFSKGHDSTSTILKNTTGVILGKFEIRNNQGDIYLNTLKFQFKKNNLPARLGREVYLVDSNTGTVLTSSGDLTNIGSLEFNLNSQLLKGNKILSLAIVSDLNINDNSDDAYQLIFNSAQYESDKENLIIEDRFNLAGDIIRVQSAKVSIYPNNDPQTVYYKGQTDVVIASFYLEAPYGENLKINSIGFIKGPSNNEPSLSNGVNNLKLYFNSRKLGQLDLTQNNNNYVFNNFNYSLTSGRKIKLELKADIDTKTPFNQIDVILSSMEGRAANNAKIQISGLNTPSAPVSILETDFNLEHTSGGSIIGATKNLISSLTIINNTELSEKELGARLNSIVIRSTGNGLSSSLGYKNLKVALLASDKNKETTIGKITYPVAGRNLINLSGSFKTGSATLNIYVDAPESITDLDNFQISFEDLKIKHLKSNQILLLNPSENSQNVIIDSQSTQIAANGFIWPINGRVNYGFNDPKHPFSPGSHNGIDIDAGQGTPVKATQAGTVIASVNGGANGYSYIVIQHSNGLVSTYGHLSRLDVGLGTIVNQGSIIGLSGGGVGMPGSGPNTTGPHLHFEIALNGSFVDPQNYLQ